MLEELLEQLVSKYPNKIPSKEISLRDLGVLQGQQEVVRYLSSLIEAQDNKRKKGNK